MIDCEHWQEIGLRRAGRCNLGRYGGRPSYGCCEKCEVRQGLAPPEPIPLPKEQRVAPFLVAKAALNIETCSTCNHFEGVEKQVFVRCGKCGCAELPAFNSDRCPLGLWRRASIHTDPAALFYHNLGRNWTLQNLFKDQTAFLICGGPSLGKMNLEDLRQPGILTMAINNATAVFPRPNLWCAVDMPGKFLESIWRDPAILKFYNHRWGVQDRPNAFAYFAKQPFVWYRYLSDNRITWGNSTMMIAIRILFDLGVRRLFLVGCDFRMRKEAPYAFSEKVNDEGLATNNNSYRMMNERFGVVRPLLESAGMHIYNATPDSALTAFDTMPYNSAVELALKAFGVDPAEEETYGRYYAPLGPSPETGQEKGPSGRREQRDHRVDAADARRND